MKMRFLIILLVSFCLASVTVGQKVNWTADGLAYTKMKDGNIVRVDPKSGKETIFINREALIPQGSKEPLKIQSFEHSPDNNSVLFFTNTARVWRYNTKGDYWLLNKTNNTLKKLGKALPAQSLMFAKFSPDGKQVAYVSGNNIFSEDLVSGQQKKLTTTGTRKLINGTFDWVYEEEFGMRDGFRWSPDSRHIAYWEVNANFIRDYFMLNTTDSVYSQVIPVEYPKVGEAPSPVRIGVVSLANSVTRWMKIDGDPRQHYITRMEWTNPGELVVQQLDRKQQESRLIYCTTSDGSSRTFWAENDEAWVDLNPDNTIGWNWVNKGQDFLWVSEKDGWRHIYKISRDGKTVTLLTKGDYDIAAIKSVDEAGGYVYFTASPNNPTQRYLYRVKINNPKDQPELVSQSNLQGTHAYDISPTAKMARHVFSNHNTPPAVEWITLPDGKSLDGENFASKLKTIPNSGIEYFKVTTEDNVILDAWMRKPVNFDASKKYPVVFYVYGEPGASTVDDSYGQHNNFLYAGDMAADGYIQVSVDNRGTPVLKGAAWRKSIYRKNGRINIRDLAMGAKKILEQPFMDKERVAVWGWSGGGSSTLHLLFQYPEMFKTGISIAPLTNMLFYDNIYTERYMGLPQENMDDYVKGSPVTYAKNLQGNLLLVHGTGDDNVHYSNSELLINELVKHNKLFEFMAYPNRTHNINEGEGTSQHLSALYTRFLRKNCVPGGR